MQKKTDAADSASESDTDHEKQGNDVSSKSNITYPANLSVVDLAYFITVPTLCYQLNYPRSSQVRVGWLVKRVIELVSCVAIMIFLVNRKRTKHKVD